METCDSDENYDPMERELKFHVEQIEQMIKLIETQQTYIKKLEEMFFKVLNTTIPEDLEDFPVISIIEKDEHMIHAMNIFNWYEYYKENKKESKND